PTPAAYLFIGTCWVIVTLIMITRASAVQALTLSPFMYIIPIIAAGVTANRRAAFGVAGLAAAMILAADLLLPHRPPLELRADGPLYPLGNLPDHIPVLMIIVLLFLCAFLSYTLERVIVTALRETDHLATDLAQAEAEIARRAREAALAATVHAHA